MATRDFARHRLVLMILLCVVNATPTFAQVGYLWTPKELTAKADVIAIVEVISTRDTGRTQNHPSLQPRLPVVEMESELRVLALLKAPDGVENLDSLRLMYFRLDMEQWQRENPTPPGMPPRGLVNAGSSLQLPPSPTRYLAFLTRISDGRYEPLQVTHSRRRHCFGSAKTAAGLVDVTGFRDNGRQTVNARESRRLSPAVFARVHSGSSLRTPRSD